MVAPIQTPPASFAVKVTGSGRPMILIPGLLSSGEVWNDVVSHYQASYECHVLTLAGFGGVPPTTPTSLARVRDDVIEYIRVKKLDHPVLVGHSLGGFAALWIASAAPDLVGPVVSVDGVPFLPALRDAAATAEAARPQAEQIRKLYESMTAEQLAMQSRMAFATMISDPTRVAAATEWAAVSSAPATGAFVAELMTRDIRADVARIKVPLLLIGAGKAFAASPDQLKLAQQTYEAQVAGVPAHNVIIDEKALHFVMFDDLPWLLTTMDGFLKGSGWPAPPGSSVPVR
ncbi:MAG: alpha/beta hydrolase [Acidobacteriota bacterium]